MAAYFIVKKGPQQGLSIELADQSQWILGSDSEVCDIFLEDPAIAAEHLRIEQRANRFVLQNLEPSEPLTINAQTLPSPYTLKDGDKIQLGNTLLEFSYKPEKTAFDTVFTPSEEDPDILTQDMSEGEEATEYTQAPTEETEIEEDRSEYGKTAYDTIFEDTEDAENLPFSLMEDSTLLLKVMAGPNAGAEIGLHKERSYILGKDPNSCDIVFQDISVSRNHAKLSIDKKGTIEIEDLGSKNGILIDGHLLEGKKILTSHNVVQMGTTTFFILDKEAGSETIYAPFAGGKEPKKEEDKSEASSPAKPKIPWKKQVIPTPYLMIASLCVVVLFSVFISFFSLFKSEPLALSEKKATEKIGKATEKFSAIQYSFTPSSGKLFLVGHVLTAVEYQELLYNLNQIPYIDSIEENVVIDEYMWKNMNPILNGNPSFKNVVIHSPIAGKFVVTGYVKTQEEGEALSEYLNINFPYLDLLQNEVIIQDVLSQTITALFLEKGFSGVNFQFIEETVIVGGWFDATQKRSFEETLNKIQQLPGVHQVKNIAIASDAETASIDISKNYQVTGWAVKEDQGISAVINGKVFSIGELLDGMKLTKITSHSILLEKDSIKYRIAYSR